MDMLSSEFENKMREDNSPKERTKIPKRTLFLLAMPLIFFAMYFVWRSPAVHFGMFHNLSVIIVGIIGLFLTIVLTAIAIGLYIQASNSTSKMMQFLPAVIYIIFLVALFAYTWHYLADVRDFLQYEVIRLYGHERLYKNATLNLQRFNGVTIPWLIVVAVISFGFLICLILDATYKIKKRNKEKCQNEKN